MTPKSFGNSCVNWVQAGVAQSYPLLSLANLTKQWQGSFWRPNIYGVETRRFFQVKASFKKWQGFSLFVIILDFRWATRLITHAREPKTRSRGEMTYWQLNHWEWRQVSPPRSKVVWSRSRIPDSFSLLHIDKIWCNQSLNLSEFWCPWLRWRQLHWLKSRKSPVVSLVRQLCVPTSSVLGFEGLDDKIQATTSS
jgi:hypothetical protein